MEIEESKESKELDLVWEVEAIAKVIKRTNRQTYHMLATGQLPAKKVGGKWVSSRGALMNHFEKSFAEGGQANA